MKERPKFRPFADVQTLGTCRPGGEVNVYFRNNPWPLAFEIVRIKETRQPNNQQVKVVGLDGPQRGRMRILGGGTTAKMLRMR